MRSDMPSEPFDLLDLLLTAPPVTADAGQAALQRLLRQAAAPAPAGREAPRKPQAAPQPPARARKARQQTKIKTTQYLDPAIHRRLSEVRDTLDAERRRRSGPKSGRLSKSRIMETALRQALEDFSAQGAHSRLARALQTAPDAGNAPEVP